MATLINYNNSNLYILPSTAIKVYPTAYRGQVVDSNNASNNATVYNPEARMLSEHNFTHLPVSTWKSSYIINDKTNYDLLDTIVVDGYIFKLAEPIKNIDVGLAAFVPGTTMYAHIKKSEINLYQDITTDASTGDKTKVLIPVLDGQGGDSLDKNINGISYFTGLAFSREATISGGEDSISLLIWKDNHIAYENLLAEIDHGAGDHSTILNKNVIASGDYSFAGGYCASATDNSSLAFGNNVNATGNGAYAVGIDTTASKIASHAEGYNTTASGEYSHTEGSNTKATMASAHAEGDNSSATGLASHAEGTDTSAPGDYSHAEGYNTSAIGDYSHSEGCNTEAKKLYSHAEGYNTSADGEYSHVEGLGTKATADNQHVIGKYNKVDDTQVEIVGYGTGDDEADRKNIRTLDQNGNEWLAGNLAINNITPNNNNEYNLGVADKQWANIYSKNILIQNSFDVTKDSDWQTAPFAIHNPGTNNNRSLEIDDNEIMAKKIVDGIVQVGDLALQADGGKVTIGDKLTENNKTIIEAGDLTTKNIELKGVVKSDLIPENGNKTLGNSTNIWKSANITDISTTNISTTNISITSPGTITGDLIPSNSDTYTLGQNNNGTITKWKEAYIGTTYGNLEGNAKTASTLKVAKKINGKDFNGSSDITTTKWGEGRTITIKDNSGTNSQANDNIDGSNNFDLLLPATITATLIGTADKAKQDEDGDAIKATYANSLTGNGDTLTLKNKNDRQLSQVTVNNVNNSNYANKINTSEAIGGTNYPIYIADDGTVTNSSTKYAGGSRVILNGTTYTSDPTIFAPTTGSTSAYMVVGNGTNAAPIWKAILSNTNTSADSNVSFTVGGKTYTKTVDNVNYCNNSSQVAIYDNENSSYGNYSKIIVTNTMPTTINDDLLYLIY